MPQIDESGPFTAEQFECLCNLILSGANVVAARRLNRDPNKIADAERQFYQEKTRAAHSLVRGA